MSRFALTLEACGIALVLFSSILLATPTPSAADSKVRPSIQRVTEVFTAKKGDRTYTCAKVGGVWRPGLLVTSDTFITTHQQMKALAAQIRRAPEARRARLEKRLKAQRKIVKVAAPLCKQGPPIPPATTSPAPTLPPIPNPTATPSMPLTDPLKALNRAMTVEDIDHLYRRAALGFVPESGRVLGLSQGAQKLVDSLLTKNDDQQAEDFARSLIVRDTAGNANEASIKHYALFKLLSTKNPLLNHLCMIHLHDIIAVSVGATSTGQRDVMLRYFDTLCSIQEYGSYRDLVKAVGVEPAMLLWLDGASNNKKSPNENYARELMELFTIGAFGKDGRPNYTDLDVATAARALTGFGVLRSAEFGWSTIFNLSAFDSSKNKTIFRGTSFQGDVYDSEDLVDLIFDRHPNAAHNVALMLAERYLRPDIASFNPALVDALAKDLSGNNFNLVATLRRLLISEAFYEARYRNTIMRSPVETTVHLLRALNSTGLPLHVAQPPPPTPGSSPPFASPLTTQTIFAITASGGHELAAPPTVFGWDRDKEFTVGSRHIAMINQITSILRNPVFNQPNNPIGWSYLNLYPPGNNQPSSEQLVDHILRLFGATVNQAQRGILVHYLNTQGRQVTTNGNISFVQTSDPWDPTKYSQARLKIAGLLRVILMMKEFRVY